MIQPDNEEVRFVSDPQEAEALVRSLYLDIVLAGFEDTEYTEAVSHQPMESVLVAGSRAAGYTVFVLRGGTPGSREARIDSVLRPTKGPG